MNAQLKPLTSGIRLNVPWADYLAIPAVSITRLKELGRSPQHYRHRLMNPKETPALSLGRAAHCAVLEPERFNRDHAVWTERTESGKMAPRNSKKWDAFLSDHADKSILSLDEYNSSLAMQSAVRSDAHAMRYLGHGEAEVTMLAEIYGHACKGRADWVTEIDGRDALVGLKSARDCRPRQFGRQSANLGYYLQWGFYYDLFKTVTGREPLMKEIVVENEAPYAVTVFNIPDEVIQQGCDEYALLLEQLAECERNQSWPGPAISEIDLVLPAWVYGEEEITYVDD